MNQVSAWIRKRPLGSFYIITFAITWGLGFSYIAVLQNELLFLLPLIFVATCAPALAGMIVTAVESGQGRPKLGRNRARWIGFARPRLQARASPLIAALVVALFWVPWHFFLWTAEGQAVFTISFWFEFHAIHVPTSIIITWLYNRSKGSILVAGIAHAAANTAIAFLPDLDWIVLIAMMAVVALLLVLMDRMWKRLPQEDPSVGHAPRLAV